MISSVMSLSLAVLAGLLLGLFYFGGLWLTVRRLPSSKRPGMLMLGSFTARLLITLCGFVLLMDGNWERIVACMAGFLATRFVITRKLAPGKGTASLL
jgi:F1F0 ATPase subunit 2